MVLRNVVVGLLFLVGIVASILSVCVLAFSHVSVSFVSLLSVLVVIGISVLSALSFALATPGISIVILSAVSYLQKQSSINSLRVNE